MGIPQADLPRIFQRFYRASNTAGRLPGAGIGLSGVRQIVEQHGGTIAVTSEEGKGATFTVRLPMRSQPLLAPAPTPSTEGSAA
jgi:signal transduction histidine kinase